MINSPGLILKKRNMTQDNEFGDQAPDDSSPNKIEDANTHAFNN